MILCRDSAGLIPPLVSWAILTFKRTPVSAQEVGSVTLELPVELVPDPALGVEADRVV